LRFNGESNSIVGRGVVLHNMTDNCQTETSSGDRLAVGVIGVKRPATGNVNKARAGSQNPEGVCVFKGTSACSGSSSCGLNNAGIAYFKDTADGVLVTAQLTGITTERAWHIHEFGDLSLSDGNSAGPHYNPDGYLHNLPGNLTRHVGDLGSIKTFNNGNGYYNYAPEYINATNWQVQHLLGRGVIVHMDVDHGLEPTCPGSDGNGAAGARVLICVIGIPNGNGASPLPVPDVASLQFNNTWSNIPCSTATPTPTPTPTTPTPTPGPTPTPTPDSTTGAGSLLEAYIGSLLILLIALMW